MAVQVEAQDMLRDKVYSDGRIVFKARKIRAFGDKGVRIVTSRGKFLYAGNAQVFTELFA